MAVRKRPKRSFSAAIEPLENRRLLSAATIDLPLLIEDPAKHHASQPSVPGYTPAQLRTAYGFNSVDLQDGSAATGAGQTIAIVDAYNDPNIISDLNTFDQEFGLGTFSLSIVNQNGKSKPSKLPADNAGWDQEIAMDVEWAHAIAPGANLLLVETKNDNTNNLVAGVQFAVSVPDVSVVSLSWGGSEFSGETADDADFIAPSGHQGVTVVAAAGDDGPGAEWPADSPDVVGVGGTTLNVSSSGVYEGETAWNDSSGGYSQFESELSYQSDVQTTGSRSSPDVAYDADPNTGIAVYDSVEYEGATGWQEIGGTSAGTPQWAGLIALADQDRVASGMGTLDGTDQTLPTLYAEYSSASADAAAFNAVSGSNTYNEQTGLGSPIASAVVNDLFNAVTTTPTVVPPSSAAGGGYRYHGRGGRLGGAFDQPASPPIAANIVPRQAGIQFPTTNTQTPAEILSTPAIDVAVETPLSRLPTRLAAAPAMVARTPAIQPTSIAASSAAAANSASATSAVSPFEAAAPRIVTSIPPVVQTAAVFSTTPIASETIQLLDCLVADRRTQWAAALAAGILLGVYASDRRKRPTSGYENSTPHHIFA